MWTIFFSSIGLDSSLVGSKAFITKFYIWLVEDDFMEVKLDFNARPRAWRRVLVGMGGFYV
jgi:hypothetical protein